MDAESLFDGSMEYSFAQYGDLRGKNVFVTGGGSGIGAYFVSAFALQGAKVGFLSLSAEKGNALCDLIESNTGTRPFYRACDIRNIDSLKSVLSEYSEAVGPVEVLVNNAARDDRISLSELASEQWDDSMNTNLRPYMFAIQSVVPGMESIGGGAIVNISSNAPELGAAGFPVYVAAKAAISGMTKALAQELGPKGIRVNAILPGWCLTERQKQLWMTDEAVQATLDRQAIKRMLTGVDLANAAIFLASQSAAMVSGISMRVDAGIA